MGLFDWLFGKRKSGDGESVAAGFAAFKDVKPELLIIGLGNPGEKYKDTRHNIGFEVVNELHAEFGQAAFESDICEALCALYFYGVNGDKPVMLVKPLTYMNLSGDAVGGLMRKYGLTPDKCFVIVDDFNIPLGKIRIRKDGSHGGHNGLKSITAAIGDGYPRLRVGIGPLPKGVAIIDFVLGRFDDSEREDVINVISIAKEAVEFMLDSGINVAMNKYN